MNTPPITLTSKPHRTTGAVGVIGPADTLRAAYETGTPITLDGKLAGQQVYLGHTRQTWDDGITLRTTGLHETIGETPNYPGIQIAIYLVDMTRLDAAPTLRALKAKADAAATRNAAQAQQRADNDAARVETSMLEDR